jgi:recA bacterial DNA recombination protein
MSSAVVPTSAASGRLFVFDAEEVDSEAVVKLRPGSTSSRPFLGNAPGRPAGGIAADLRLASVTPASRLEVRPVPEMVSTGIPAIDALTGGLPRGCLTEICGPASSGRTTLLLSALAAATRRGEFCVVVDANDALDPQSVAAAGVQLEKLLWVRCGEDSPPRQRGLENKNQVTDSGRIESQQRLEQVLRATDLLLDSGGFGLIVLDLGDLPPKSARYIPLTTWFRFRRTVEHTPTVLLVIEQQPIVGSCSSLLLKLGPAEDAPAQAGKDQPGLDSHRSPPHEPSHSQLLTGMNLTAELLRARPERKPARSVSVAFSSKTAWAG